MVGKGLHPMMSFGMFLYSLWEMQGFTYCESKPMFFYCLLFNLLIDRWTLFCWLMAFTHWLMLSLLTPFEQTWYHKQFFLVGWLQQWQHKWRKDFIIIRYPIDVFLPLVINVFKYFHRQSNNFLDQYINILWIIAKALKALTYWCCICFIVKKCQWFNKEHKPLPSQDRLLLQGRVLLSLEVY
jgi:hypothetical protein